MSVVSVSKGIVTDTIYAKDEPADVVFAGSNAFVSISRSGSVYVYNAATHAPVRTIPLFGGNPRAMTVTADGKTIYVLFAISGNTPLSFRLNWLRRRQSARRYGAYACSPNGAYCGCYGSKLVNFPQVRDAR